MIVRKPVSNRAYADLAVYCNENNCHIEDKGAYLESVPNDPPPAPTYEEIRAMRIQYRRDHIDDETNHRTRCIANKKWTEKDEAWYLDLDREVTAYIEEHFPYPEESES